MVPNLFFIYVFEYFIVRVFRNSFPTIFGIRNTLELCFT